MSLDKLISSYEKPSVPARRGATPLEYPPLIATAFEKVTALNEKLPEARQVDFNLVDELLQREEPNGEFAAERALSNYISTVENPATNRPTEHVDLLPETHPMSTRWISTFSIREKTAEYYAAGVTDPEVSAILASAITADPLSGTRRFYLAMLDVKDTPLSVVDRIAEADEVIAKKELRPY